MGTAMLENLREPLLTNELDGPWDEATLQRELKNLKAYQQTHAELYSWVKANFATLERVAVIYGIDLNELTEESIESVPDMHPVIRAGFYRALLWCRLAMKISPLQDYQAQQKRRKSYGVEIIARIIGAAVEAELEAAVAERNAQQEARDEAMAKRDAQQEAQSEALAQHKAQQETVEAAQAERKAQQDAIEASARLSRRRETKPRQSAKLKARRAALAEREARLEALQAALAK